MTWEITGVTGHSGTVYCFCILCHNMQAYNMFNMYTENTYSIHQHRKGIKMC